MGEPIEDKQLVEQSSSGDREAFRGLVDRYQGKLLRLVTQLVRSREDAEDIVQESFVKAYLSIDSFRGQSSFYTWLYRIAFNMAIDFKRKVSRRGGDSAPLEDVDTTKNIYTVQTIESPSDVVSRKEQAELISKALHELSEEHRTVIVLREIDGLSYEEIAKVMGISKGTVMSRLHYARKKMQTALKDEYSVSSMHAENSESEEIVPLSGAVVHK